MPFGSTGATATRVPDAAASSAGMKCADGTAVVLRAAGGGGCQVLVPMKREDVVMCAELAELPELPDAPEPDDPPP
jgi:hypothetical protein